MFKHQESHGAFARGLLPPSTDDLRPIAEQYHLHLTDADLTFFAQEIEGLLGTYRRINEMVEPEREIKYPRSPGHRPQPGSDPLNAWARCTQIKGASTGKLSGKTVALKDNVSVAGVPMMNGSPVLQGFIPDVDATVVTRILDAGGEIAGKAVCEDHSMSAWPSAATGPVLNPHNPEFSAGGSSSGSAALVAGGYVDMAIGGDQGGSIRIPASFCGVYGMKPTFGLIPYTGIMGLDNTIDHAGPIARTVEDVALLLESVAGEDPEDPRQRGPVPTEEYTSALTGKVDDLRFGLLTEGFDWPDSPEPDVDDAVREAAQLFSTRLSAQLSEVSVPMHRDGMHIHLPIHTDGALTQVFQGNGVGRNWKGYYPTSLVEFYGKAKVARADAYSDAIKLQILMAQYLQDRYSGVHYARAQNLSKELNSAYEAAFRDVDILIMPTTPRKATRLNPNADRKEHLHGGFGSHWNTCPFNVTGHPAITVPCAKSDGLPIGMMLVGRKFEDSTVLRAAHAFQELGEYR